MPSAATDIEILERRLALLERQQRRMTRTGAVGLALVGAALLMGQTPPPAGPSQPTGRVVEAEKFIVRDAKGQERAVLGLDHPVSPEHSPLRLGLYNGDKSSAILYLSDGFAGLSITSGGETDKKQAVQLFANPREGGGFKVATGERREAVRIAADGKGKGSVTLTDTGGAVVFKAP
jgi:hypothetical protein